MNALLLAGGLLAQGPVDPSEVKPGWVALVIVLLMGLATFLLWRSMNRQLGRVRFDEGGGRDGADDTPDGGGRRSAGGAAGSAVDGEQPR